jgi:S1-C subfamily serine protease
MVSTDPGILLLGIDPGSPADRAGLQPGDLLLQANGKRLFEPTDLSAVLTGVVPGDTLSLLVRREKGRRHVDLPVTSVPRGYPGFSVRSWRDMASLRSDLPADLPPADERPCVNWIQPGMPWTSHGKFGIGAVILALNGEPVQTLAEYQAAADSLRVGDAVSLEFFRNGRHGKLTYLAQSRPRPWSGLRLEEISPFLVEAESLGAGAVAAGGLFVRRVEAGSPADRAGLKPRDQILRFAGERLVAIDDFIGGYEALDLGQTIPLTVRHADTGIDTLTLVRGGQLGAVRIGEAQMGNLIIELAVKNALPLPIPMRGAAIRAIPLPVSWTKVTGAALGGRAAVHLGKPEERRRSVVAFGPWDREPYLASAGWDFDYGLGDERWHHLASLGGRQPGLPRITYEDRPRPFHNELISNPGETTFLAMVAGEDNLRYVNARGWRAEWLLMNRSLPGHDLEIKLGFLHETPLPTISDRSLFGRSDFTPNPTREISRGRSHSATLRYTFERVNWRAWTQTMLRGEVRAAGGLLEGDHEFVRWEANILRSLRLERRFYLDAHLRAGLATGELPYQEWFFAGGKGTLPGFENNEFGGDRTLLLRSRLAWVPFGRPEQFVQFRIFTGLDTGNAWRERDVSDIPSLRTNLVIGAGVFLPGTRQIPFPQGISLTWGKPLDDSGREWLFQLNLMGGAPR